MTDLEYELLDKEKRKNVRVRNLTINIAKQLLDLDISGTNPFSIEEIKFVFGFKEYDIREYVELFFRCKKGQYYLINDKLDYINRIIECNRIAKPYIKEAEAEYIRTYGRFKANYEGDPFGINLNSEYKKIYLQLKEIIPIIHWNYLPIFNKSLLYNRDINPEIDTLRFYDHIDCMNVLLDEIKGKALKMDVLSDQTLFKEFKAEIFTRLQKKYLPCVIKRTIDGWNFEFETCKGDTRKDGGDLFFDFLDKHHVFSAEEGVAYAFFILWQNTDDGLVNCEQLNQRINQIIDWINETEKAMEDIPTWIDPECLMRLRNAVSTKRIKQRDEIINDTIGRDIKLKIYSRRWKAEDTYTLCRTKDGWLCRFSLSGEKTKINGEGGFFQNLEHDSILFPKENIKCALEQLWYESELGLLDFAQLENRIIQLGKWISSVERSNNKQPDWVNYY